MSEKQPESAPPFYQTLSEKRSKQTRSRQQISLFTMEFGLMVLTAAFLGGFKLALDLLQKNSSEGLIEKSLLLGVAYLLGWIICLVSIRIFGNLILPIVLRGYLLAVVAGLLMMYAKIVIHLFRAKYHPQNDLPPYLFLLGIGFLIVISLELLVDELDIRPLSIPLLAGATLHLFSAILYYLFMATKYPQNIYGHLIFFVFMLSMAGLMLAHFGVLAPARNLITKILSKTEKTLKPDE